MLRLGRSGVLRGRSTRLPTSHARALSTPLDQMAPLRGTSKLALFPWRVSPKEEEQPAAAEERKFWDDLKMNSRNYISKEIIQQLLSQPHFNTMSSRHSINYMDPRGGEFLTGARQAFQVASNGVFAGFSKYKKVYTDDDNEHWDEVVRSMTAGTDSQADRFKRIVAPDEGARSNMDQIADIIHATIFGGSNAPPDAEKRAPFRTPLSGLAETMEKEKAYRSAEKDSVLRGVAAPIEYADEWDTTKSPPSASYAPNALSAMMDSKLALFYEEALSRMRGKYTLHHTLHKMHLPKFSQCEIIFNAKRGYNFDLVKRHYMFGVIGVAVLGDPPQRSAPQKTPGAGSGAGAGAGGQPSMEQDSKSTMQENVLLSSEVNSQKDLGQHQQQPTFTLTSSEMSQWLEMPAVQQAKQELKKMRNIATIRVQVELPCKETFYVTDNNTGLIVQGQCIPRDTKHSIVLEGSFSSDEDKFPTFSIVDIDDWLHGNKFI